MITERHALPEREQAMAQDRKVLGLLFGSKRREGDMIPLIIMAAKAIKGMGAAAKAAKAAKGAQGAAKGAQAGKNSRHQD